MDFSWWYILIAFTSHLESNHYVIGFISKATVEAVSIVPLLRSNQTNSIGSVAKVSQLFHAKKSNVEKIPKSTISNVTVVPKEDRTINISEEPLKLPLSSRFVQKREGDVIYNRSSNPLISSESWNDLNTVLSEKEMKTFLSSLPLHTLRNLTTMTRKNPELGQKQLVRLIVDRSERLKYKVSGMNDMSKADISEHHKKIDISKMSGHKTNSLGDNNHSKKAKLARLGLKIKKQEAEEIENLLDLNEIRPSDSLYVTTTPTLPVLEPPTEAVHSTSAPESPRKNRVFPLPSLEAIAAAINSERKDENAVAESSNKNIVHETESTRQMSSSFNSGYFIPLLTSDLNADENKIDPSKPSQFSWHYQPQDPENTFQPHIDKFLQPPNEFDLETSGIIQHDSSSPPVMAQSSTSSGSSSVWLAPNSPGLSSLLHTKNNPNEGRDNDKSHPFSGFHTISDVKLNSAASNDNELYLNPNQGFQEQEYQQPLEEDEQNPTKKYHYTHSTMHQGPPNSQNQVHSSYPQTNQQNNHNYKQHSNSNNNHQNYNDNNINNNPISSNYNNQPNQPQQQQPQNVQVNQQQPSVNSVSVVENSPSYYGNGWGWGDQGPDIWSKAKAYFSKGGKSTSEKVFEISLAVLSFLAFGGYLIMLIYQVFAVTSVVPLFPFFSSTIPANPTLMGVLLGRSSGDQNTKVVTLGRHFDDNYINEVETIVKGAMDRVKTMWETNGISSPNAKGDLGH